MLIALAPINPIVGDLSGNLGLVKEKIKSARARGANLVLFPELSLIGYPPQDLILRTSYPEAIESALKNLEGFIRTLGAERDFAVVIGAALPSPEGSRQPLMNAAVFLDGKQRIIRAKSLIPHYDVFHERRYFASALDLDPEFREPIPFLDEKLGLLICEDSWSQLTPYNRKLYSVDPAENLVGRGASVLLNLSASPFTKNKLEDRRRTICAQAKSLQVPILYVNALGANDEIIFDGDAFFVSTSGALVAASQRWCEDILFCDLAASRKASASKQALENASLEQEPEVLAALKLGLLDYVRKNKLSTVVLGLSGGIDSALVATIAVDALGADKVFGFSLPSKFSSAHSIADAELLARNLGMRVENFSIKFLQSTMDLALKPFFANRPIDATEENIQARLRGLVLMAMSNKFGHLLLATGNKSELAVGYSTLYGDMCGGLAPIGDLYKTEVYRIARYLNKEKARIPEGSLTKAPSAELRPNQTDQDSLPPYDDLDAILYELVDREQSQAEALSNLARQGRKLSAEVVADIERRLVLSEFKRQQFAPILKISTKAFGMGRRYPVTKRIPDLVAISGG